MIIKNKKVDYQEFLEEFGHTRIKKILDVFTVVYIIFFMFMGVGMLTEYSGSFDCLSFFTLVSLVAFILIGGVILKIGRSLLFSQYLNAGDERKNIALYVNDAKSEYKNEMKDKMKNATKYKIKPTSAIELVLALIIIIFMFVLIIFYSLLLPESTATDVYMSIGSMCFLSVWVFIEMLVLFTFYHTIDVLLYRKNK